MSSWYSYLVGLDLGQASDYTALSVVEQQLWSPRDHAWLSPANLTATQLTERLRFEGTPPTDRPLHVRHLERLPLGTSYPAIVADVAARLRSGAMAGKGIALLIDATGVGRPVVDMFKAASLRPVAITITGGAAVGRDRGGYTVPKRQLVSSLQVALQQKRLRIARTLEHAATFEQEALNFKVKISVAGHDSYEAWRESTHDDLVLSVAMTTWFASIKVPSNRLVTF